MAREQSSFVGRKTELAQLEVVRKTTRVLTLVGPGGSGKSRLALRLAGLVTDSLPNGRSFVDVSGLAAEGLLMPAVARAVGADLRAHQASMRWLVDTLGERRTVLLLDNCESRIGECADLVATLIRECHGIQVLATSREPLGIHGEVAWRVPALGVPPAGVTGTRRLLAYDAVALFFARLKERRRGFVLTARDANAIARLCRRLAGLPLALEIVAYRVPFASLELETARLHPYHTALLPGSNVAPPRQRSLWATLDWSHARLTQSEQILLRRLAVFVGGWTLGAAEAVCADDTLPAASVAGLLDNLVRKSIIEVEHHENDANRYRFDTFTRQYASARLRQAGEDDRVRGRHALFVLELGTRIHPARFDVAQTDKLDREQGNLRGALRWAIHTGQAEIALGLALAGYTLWYLRGQYAQGSIWLAHCAALPVTDELAARSASVASLAAHLALLAGNMRAARAHLATAMRTQELSSNHPGKAPTLHFLGVVALWSGDVSEARKLCQATIQALLQVSVGDDLTRLIHSAALTLNARLACEMNEDVRAAQMATQLAHSARARADRFWLARALHLQAVLAERRNLQRLGLWLITSAIALQRAQSDIEGLVASLCELGRLELRRGAQRGALVVFDEALGHAQRNGLRLGIAWAVEGVAGAVERGRPADAVRLMCASDTLRETLGCRVWPSERRHASGVLARARSRLSPAAYAAARSAGRATDVGDAIHLVHDILTESVAQEVKEEQLTRRETEVARLTAQGLSNDQIARELAVSIGTVRTHVDRILAKLGVHSRAQVAVWALALGSQLSPG